MWQSGEKRLKFIGLIYVYSLLKCLFVTVAKFNEENCSRFLTTSFCLGSFVLF